MNFAERAVKACVEAMEKGISSQRHVRDVLRYKDADVTPIERFLVHVDPMIRMMATEVIGAKGNIAILVSAAIKEEDRSVLLNMMKSINRKSGGVESLVLLLSSPDLIVKNACIDMFKRLGMADCLFPLIFDKDDALVQRIKRYLEDEERQNSKTACA